MTEAASTPSVVEDEERRRYEISVGGAEAGFAEYVRRGGRTIFVHTEIDDAFSGQGLGSKLVKAALDAERESGRPVVPLCPFVHGYIEKHPEYDELVDHVLLAVLDSE